MASRNPQLAKPPAKPLKRRGKQNPPANEPHAAPETGEPANFYAEDETRRHKSRANVTLVARSPD